MDENTRKRLLKIYKTDVKKLESLLGKNLADWYL
jgi:hypothetical protein